MSRHTVYIALGANLGDASATLAAALSELTASPGLTLEQASSLYRTAPIDSDGPDYLNAVARFSCTLEPLALLDLLQLVETQHGRERPYRNAPRTLDLDLILYDDLTMDHPRLTLPHPRAHQRAFVLVPLAELAPSLQLAGQTVQAWLPSCADQRLERLASAPTPFGDS